MIFQSNCNTVLFLKSFTITILLLLLYLMLYHLLLLCVNLQKKRDMDTKISAHINNVASKEYSCPFQLFQSQQFATQPIQQPLTLNFSTCVTNMQNFVTQSNKTYHSKTQKSKTQHSKTQHSKIQTNPFVTQLPQSPRHIINLMFILSSMFIYVTLWTYYWSTENLFS